MIRRLRRRMTLMVIAVLILVSAGIVLAIHLANGHSIAAQAEETLAVLVQNSRSGSEGTDETRPQKPDGSTDTRGGRPNRDRRGFRGEPPEIRSGGEAAAAGLSNSYTISLNADGSVASWTSDRADKIAREHPTGSSAIIRYNPADPEDSIFADPASRQKNIASFGFP